MTRKLAVTLIATLTASAYAANLTSSLKSGKAELKSAGPLAFGPEGILFVGDPLGAQIFAISTGDTKAAKTAEVEVSGLHEKIANLLGTTADQILVADLAVNPVSKRAYLSVSRGRGPEAIPVLLRVSGGKLEEVNLSNIAHSKVALPNAPSPEAKARGQLLRMEAITDLAYSDGKVLVAGLSNEEFASNLRSVPFPFEAAGRGSSIEIYHGNHGRFETNSPVRTFTPYSIAKKPHILAAYTCTPLVTIPMSDLEPGKKVMGRTIAELGNRNRPLDMVVYKKGANHFVLMNNSSRGVMKIQADGLEGFESIKDKVADKAGVPYETIAGLKGVEQLDRLDANTALMLVREDSGAMELKKLALP
ncbi:MAG: hypothetical protein FJW39_27340 [Acidobacteria bacterium]|nr:hypothetical protein [Acidobacteriota bacterium]